MMHADPFQTVALAREELQTQLRKRIVGQDHVIELVLTALLAKGHCLLLGVPGLAKTTLVSTLAQSLGLAFNRIQFTPDLMPSDITGTDILESNPENAQKHFRFVKGPVFCNLLLADEINRTPPKTQAALLQSMQELQVTVGGRSFQLDPPFLVFATQNPIEQEGTYPLPEAQLDRFMFNIRVDYPSPQEEFDIVRNTTAGALAQVQPVLDKETILALQQLVLGVPVSDEVIKYAVSLATATRPQHPQAPSYVRDFVAWGAGPRASQYLVLAAKARAVLLGERAPSRHDLRILAPDVLRHRIIMNFNADAQRFTADHLIQRLLDDIKP
ncbi:MAG: MoxR family ATPase [Myxococcota bacterium]|jgi:MoxR-like ATPase|nr:MoxR family ATPase [Myxococcota bacterium]